MGRKVIRRVTGEVGKTRVVWTCNLPVNRTWQEASRHVGIQHWKLKNGNCKLVERWISPNVLMLCQFQDSYCSSNGKYRCSQSNKDQCNPERPHGKSRSNVMIDGARVHKRWNEINRTDAVRAVI